MLTEIANARGVSRFKSAQLCHYLRESVLMNLCDTFYWPIQKIKRNKMCKKCKYVAYILCDK